MAELAVGGVEKCLICDKEYNSLNPLARSPTCSQLCWQILTEVINHGGLPCWIPGCLEVSCGSSASTPKSGHCCDLCQIFKIEEEIKKRWLDKDTLFGAY